MASQFGQLLELIVGGVSQIIMGASVGAEALSTRSYVKSREKTEKEAEQAQLDLERKRIAFQEQASQTKVQIEELKNIRARKIASLVVFAIIIVTVFGLLVFYRATVGSSE